MERPSFLFPHLQLPARVRVLRAGEERGHLLPGRVAKLQGLEFSLLIFKDNGAVRFKRGRSKITEEEDKTK